ncbi:hypothetical protein [Caballeronia sp. ATUFL_M2_KS44]|uniref:hypothetical protein n=1 Tax=Caballeronia sp. ATUFL_M2_KS44 TaxID=2921767 RepID=UPI0020291004|nr:hypothetical protein [Caballeronia sp. ATUFL_M2_KS44]
MTPAKAVAAENAPEKGCLEADQNAHVSRFAAYLSVMKADFQPLVNSANGARYRLLARWSACAPEAVQSAANYFDVTRAAPHVTVLIRPTPRCRRRLARPARRIAFNPLY